MLVRLRRFVSSNYFVPLLVFVIYFVLNLGIGGPAYLSDEVGYLNKAATIAGSVVHMSTSWFGGYSLLISPAFLLSPDPYIEWTIVILLNALMWTGSAYLLHYTLRNLYPNTAVKTLQFVTLGAMLYPSWLSMSGYAFSTSGFVLVFMAALGAILKSKLSHKVWLIVAGLLAGYLCWIHPIGFLLLGLLVILFIIQSVLQKRWWPTLIAITSTAFAASYSLVIHPLFDRVMSGNIVNDDHYNSGIADILQAATTLHYWLQVGLLLIGLLFFIAIATFGLAIYGSLPIIKQFLNRAMTWRTKLQDTGFVIRLLSLLLVVGAVCFTALSFAVNQQLRIDQWVYGRYIDMYLLPIIGLGLLAAWRYKQALIIAGTVVIAGIALSLATNSDNTSFIFNNKVNLQGLWPMHLASIIHANHYWLWAVLGALGIIVAGFMGTKNYKRLLVLLIIPVILTGASNYLYHQTIVKQHSTVSSLYQYIKNTSNKSECIGFTPAPDTNERFNLYSYYLHGYNIQQMTLEQWQQNNCNGPYLTYDKAQILDGLRLIGTEEKTGLLVIDHTNPNHALITPIIFN